VGTFTAAVLLTDLVGSTALRVELGEEAADDVRRRHDAVLGTAIARSGGRVVKGTGDGLLATFETASDALDGGLAVQAAVAELARESGRPLAVRVGIACGDVTSEGGDCFGRPVVEASRLCDLAEGGQVLCTTLVSELAGGNVGHERRHLGARTLEGLEDPVGVHEVG